MPVLRIQIQKDQKWSDSLGVGGSVLSKEILVTGRNAASVAIVMFVVFVVLVVLLHFIRPEMPPLTSAISDYATGEFGILMRIAFLALAVGLAALAVSASQGLSLHPRPRVDFALLVASSVLMLLVAVFRSGDLQATEGAVHSIASLLFFVVLMIAMLVISIKLKLAGRLSGRCRALLWLSVAAPIVFVVMFVMAFATLFGLGQRIYIFTWISWLVLIAIGIRYQAFGSVKQVPWKN